MKTDGMAERQGGRKRLLQTLVHPDLLLAPLSGYAGHPLARVSRASRDTTWRGDTTVWVSF